MTPSHRQALTSTTVRAELERVSAALASTASSDREARMPLLRRQAALGDLRDDLDKRARRGIER